MAGKDKIIITGTGRCGTTFLVEFLNELGLDVDMRGRYYSESRAGFESMMNSPHQIIKSPRLLIDIDSIASRVSGCLLCVRDPHEAAMSRCRLEDGPGGLWLTERGDYQEAVLNYVFHRGVYALARHGIPTTIIAFPRMALDVGYLWDRIWNIKLGMTRAEFLDAHARIAKPEMITCSSTPQ